MRPLRFFYIPNENVEGDQVGPHKAFRLLHEQGVFSALASYSYLVERKRFKTQAEALEDLYQAAAAFGPDVIFWQHLNSTYPVDREFLRRLKALATQPKFVWHDPDPYGKLIKPIDPVMKVAIAEAHAVVVKGLGYFSEDLRRVGAKKIIYAIESYDDERFDSSWTPTLTREFDAVMIANLPCLKRIPFLFLPGGRNRKSLAQRFYGAFGKRFAVFGAGQGWSKAPYCHGPIKFSDQERILRSGWLSINWSQFDTIPMYFSDRLPISLATGVPHITNYQRGFEHVLPGMKGIYLVQSPAEALDVADMLLSLPREKLNEIGQEGVAYARERLNAVRVYSDIITAICEQVLIADRE